MVVRYYIYVCVIQFIWFPRCRLCFCACLNESVSLHLSQVVALSLSVTLMAVLSFGALPSHKSQSRHERVFEGHCASLSCRISGLFFSHKAQDGLGTSALRSSGNQGLLRKSHEIDDCRSYQLVRKSATNPSHDWTIDRLRLTIQRS